MWPVRPRELNKLVDDLRIDAQTFAIHVEQFATFSLVWSWKRLDITSATNNSGIKGVISVRAKNNKNTSLQPPRFVDLLNKCVNTDLILMVTLVCRSRGRQ